MARINHDSVREIRRFLSAEGLTLKKRWGQNFLVRREVRSRIVEHLLDGAGGWEVQPPLIWEVGPGLGAMTELLMDRGVPPIVFEIDHGLIRLLSREFGPHLTIVAGDFLTTWPEALDRYGAPRRILGNLPYSSGSRIIVHLVEADFVPERMVFLVQTELAQRFASSPATKSYGALSVTIQLRYTVEQVERVPGSAFFPPPDVESTVVVFHPRIDLPDPAVYRAAVAIAREAFSQRRKKLSRMFKIEIPDGAGGVFSPETLEQAFYSVDLSPDLRPEALTPGEYLALAKACREIRLDLPGNDP
jgi:16S rRNA (adenine1518-N6/adenine1519-N6)-dimethyltransferase